MDIYGRMCKSARKKGLRAKGQLIQLFREKPPLINWERRAQRGEETICRQLEWLLAAVTSVPTFSFPSIEKRKVRKVFLIFSAPPTKHFL